jgi:hypothetical protein
MKVTEAMLECANAASGLGIGVRSTIRRALEAALADVPEPETLIELTQAAVADYNHELLARRTAEAKLAKVRELAMQETSWNHRMELLAILNGDVK